jgi:hypothetical protein
MKAILEFDFDKEDSDDRSQFQDAVNGSKMKAMMWEFDQWLRSKTKYASDATPEDYTQALYDARDKFYEFLGKYSIDINE